MRSSPYRHALVSFALAVIAACGDDIHVVDTHIDSASDTGAADADDIADTADADDVADTADVTTTPPDLAARPDVGEVRAGAMTKAADLIGGPKAEGLVGDIKLWNARVAFVIETVRDAGGYREHGGNVVDADFSSGGEDLFGELWFAWNLQLFHPDKVEIVSDGGDGAAVVRFSGRTGRYVWIETFLSSFLQPPVIDLGVVFEYRLAPDDNVLDLTVTLSNDTAEEADISLPMIAMNMGDGVSNFGIGGGIGGVTGNSQPWLGMIGLMRSYGFIGEGKLLNGLFNYQNVQLLQADPFLLAPGASTSQHYGFVVGDDGTTSVARAAADRFGVSPVVSVRGSVSGEVGWEDDEQPPDNSGGRSWVTAFKGEAVHGITPVADDGTFSLLLAPGTYELRAYASQRGASEPATVVVADAAVEGVALALPELGEVVVTVSDGDSAPLPCQISFFRDEAPRPFSPENAGFDTDWRRGRSAIVFSPDGLGRAHLLPGSYTVTASRGYSYTFDQADVTVTPGGTQTINLTIDKQVDDSGWVAADLHLHSIWSPDSNTPYVTRLRQAAAVDVALPMFTEHVNVGHPQASLAEAAVGDYVVPVPAQEITTFEYGHFNAYPMEYRPDEPAFGAVFEHGHAGPELFDAIRHQHEGDHLIQINHPRQATTISAFFTYVDFDRDTASSPNARWTTNWDVLEVFNGSCARGGDNNGEALLDWFAMNDHGLGKVLGSGSDSHSAAAGLGTPRSWIAVERSAVEADVEAFVAPLRARKSFVSCGPFVRFTTTDGKGMGELAKVDGDGRVTFDVEVSAPSWIALSDVTLLENGVAVDVVQAADFAPVDGAMAVRHRGTLSGTPSADAWYVLEVHGTGDLWPVDPGESPYAMTNPIEVDQDGDGAWTPPSVTLTAPRRARAPRPLPRGDMPEFEAPHE